MKKTRKVIAFAAVWVALGSPGSAAACCSFDVDGVHVNPGNPIAPIVPKPIDDAAQQAANAAKQAAAAAAQAAKDAADAAAKAAAAAATAAAKSVAAPTVTIIDVATGKPADQALQQAFLANANALQQTGEAASSATEGAENVKVTAAGAFAGDVGQTIVQITEGPARLQEEFASTLVISGAEVLQGANANQLAAAPLAAALRAAQAQYSPTAKPIPPDVKRLLAPFYPASILDNARYAISTISISVPDLITRGRKTFDGSDFAVTVGNIMVFIKDPETNLHWWAHEVQHTVQYANWGIDKFALNYVSSCHSVEADAESHAQAAFPITPAAQLGC